MVRQNRTQNRSFLTKTGPEPADFSLGETATTQHPNNNNI